ncbi:hypothetical protein LBMAG52_16960 [Planctomycetia bacterium]|nr:hypothetical protein LBMAG52_16960 [Planctomycetia bacterium]
MTHKYSMIIEWSDADAAFVATLPEFPSNRTHGATYEEAARNGQEVLGMLIDVYRDDGKPLPEPRVLRDPPVLV